jgi:hypothetical protein
MTCCGALHWVLEVGRQKTGREVGKLTRPHTDRESIIARDAKRNSLNLNEQSGNAIEN